jgi:hypothetical protein
MAAAEKDKVLESLVQKHGEGSIVVLSVEVSKDDVAKAYLLDPKKAPNKFSLYTRAMQFAKRQQTLEAGMVALNHCWLEGDPRFKDQDDLVAITGAIEFYLYLSFLSSSSATI